MIKLLRVLTKIVGESYRGGHKAPSKSDGAPMHDLTDFYPDDIYSPSGVRYYGDGDIFDQEAINIISAARGKPNFRVKVYRAVPKVITNKDKIAELEKQKAYIQKHGKIPPNATQRDIWKLHKSDYYEKISDALDKLEALPIEDQPKKIQINKGDWVSISKGYAVQHGKSTLNNQYKILTKVVKAKDLYTEANSILEWGYAP